MGEILSLPFLRRITGRKCSKVVKPQRRPRGTFMRVLTKESSSQSRCAEVDLRFRAVAQRLIIVKPQKAPERNFYESPYE